MKCNWIILYGWNNNSSSKYRFRNCLHVITSYHEFKELVLGVHIIRECFLLLLVSLISGRENRGNMSGLNSFKVMGMNRRNWSTSRFYLRKQNYCKICEILGLRIHFTQPVLLIFWFFMILTILWNKIILIVERTHSTATNKAKTRARFILALCFLLWKFLCLLLLWRFIQCAQNMWQDTFIQFRKKRPYKIYSFNEFVDFDLISFWW